MICGSPLQEGLPNSVDQRVVGENKLNLYQMYPSSKSNSLSKPGFGTEFEPVVDPEYKENGSDEDEEEQKMVKLLTEHPKGRDWSIKPFEPTRKKQKSRKDRPKRRDRLEIEIAKLILNQAQNFDMRDFNVDRDNVCALSTGEILLDLAESSVGTPSPSSIDPRKDSGDENAVLMEDIGKDKSGPRSLGKTHSRASESDLFTFNTSSDDDEWAEFDDSSMMNIPLLPSSELDKDGFPLIFESEAGKESFSRGGLESIDDAVSSDLVLNSEGRKESENQQKEGSCKNSIARSESEPNLPCLIGNPHGTPIEFEMPQSPSSVTNFTASERDSPSRKALVLPLKRGQTSGPSIATQRLAWNPKPPKHYTNVHGAH
ncbi:unnamed protein product [Pseudo-nitzschia multistriata]|uniref:Uncharacterized protein n=1 Tax=Pseudo-nitzschia multistriata TaxID=183589 RepID=A0A448Z6P0_9STRA|nr:unnamed protein product [Pseudo-nitzschia multistriata]